MLYDIASKRAIDFKPSLALRTKVSFYLHPHYALSLHLAVRQRAISKAVVLVEVAVVVVATIRRASNSSMV